MKNTNTKIEIHKVPPVGFIPQVQVAACYLEIHKKLLLLQRAQGKLEPGKWGVPAGKLENNETPENAAKRELLEETGIFFENPTRFQRLNSLYIRKPEVDYVYHVFKVQLDQMPEVHLSDEHQNYTWATAEEMETIALMDGAKEALRHYHAMIVKKG